MTDRAAAMTLNVGTRASTLALAQTDAAMALFRERHAEFAAPGRLARIEISTTGDQVLDRPLADIGGKGLFSKEIDRAMLDGRIDFAVHSMKDLETWMPAGIVIAAVLPREDPRDMLIAAAGGIDDLLQGSRIGTSSVRRQAQLLHRRPDLVCVPFRGNVGTRLKKLDAGEADATILACAGLNRLGQKIPGATPIPTDVMLPACAQGAVAITCRENDETTRALLAALNDPATDTRVTAERAVLEALDGSCRTPIGGLAEVQGGRLRLQGLVAGLDGKKVCRGAREGGASDARAMGLDLGAELKALAGPDIFAAGG
ncbi:MAG: hydroxymethylbilane synthase [Rhodospirillaceae bacterium]